ncbi:MAG: hypothetical protein GY765_26455, partial [bacterium]|nr:hypothetical protein [bacterium]
MNDFNQADKKNIGDILGLTPMQQGMLFHYLKAPAGSNYVEQLSLELKGTIDIDRIESAWNRVIADNDMLRTVFRWEKIKNPVQLILKTHAVNLRFHDFSGLGDSSAKAALTELENADRAEAFDLTSVPFRVTLCRRARHKAVMIITNHHILYDGWSNGIILKEFFTAYNTLMDKGAPGEQEKTPFKEFIKWSAPGTKKKHQETFWKNYLHEEASAADDKAGGTGGRKKSEAVTHTGKYAFTIPAELTSLLESFAKTRRITLPALMTYAWGLLVQAVTGNHDILFHTTVSGRNAGVKDRENMVGLFINTLPVRLRTSPTDVVGDIPEKVYAQLQDRQKFENTPLADINEYMESYGRQSLLDSLLVLENYPLDQQLMKEKGHMSVESFSISGMTDYDLTLIITLFDAIDLDLTYNKDIFHEDQVSALCSRFALILQETVSNPGKRVSEILVNAEQERASILEVLRQSARDSQLEDVPYVAPRNEVESTLAEVWARVLNLDAGKLVGIDDDFFHFGGHSLKATLLITAIHEALEVKIPLADIFKHPTIRAQAELVAGSGKEEYRPFEQAAIQSHYPLSSAQKRFYMLQQADLRSTAYNAPYFMLLEGEVDKGRLEEAFKVVISRHDSLRTAFVSKSGEPVQVISPEVEFHLEEIATVTPSNGKERTKQIPSEKAVQLKAFGSAEPFSRKGFCPPEALGLEALAACFVRPFDLGRAPLLRIGLHRTDGGGAVLLFDIHHIVSDGTSVNILISEFMKAYAGRELPQQRCQYKDFSQWQNTGLQNGAFQDTENFWLQQFAGELPVLDLPLDFPRPPVQSFAGDRLNIFFQPALTQKLTQLTKETGTTLYMLLTAGLGILLGKYSGSEDIIIGSPIAGRHHKDLDTVFGLFVEMLAIRLYPEGRKNFRQYLEEVKETTLQSYENQAFPFGELKKKIRYEDDMARNPLFDVMLIVQNQGRLKLEMEGLTITPLEVENKTSKLDINIEVFEEEKGTRVELEYCTALFKRATMERFFNHFERLLTEVTASPGMLLSSIQIMDEVERQRVVDEFNQTEADFNLDTTVHELFRSRVQRAPEALAAVC